MEITPIAHIRTDFKDKFGIPRQSGRVPSLCGRIVFCKEYRNPDAIREIESFSHLWLIFGFSKAVQSEWSPTVRPPRLGGNKKIGVFASRSPYRPNSLGLSCVKLEKIEGNDLIVSGVDLLDMTPIYDIKPYLPFADSKSDAAGGYADDHKNHRLKVVDENNLLSVLQKDKQKTAIDCIADDPRPSYQSDDRVYSMRFCDVDIHFKVENETAKIIDIS